MFDDVNWLALAIASVAMIVVGFVWYSPSVFGGAWIKLTGMSKADLKKSHKENMGKTFVLAFIQGLVIAYALSMFFGWLGVETTEEALQMGLYLWLIPAAFMYGGVLWEKMPVNLWLLNAAYQLVAIEVIGLVLLNFPA